MILVKKKSGGTGMFRTSRGNVAASVSDGYYVVDVSGRQAKDMQVVHKFHGPPSNFVIKKKEEPKPAPAPAPAPAAKVEPKPAPAPKKTTSKSTKKTTSAKAKPK